MAVPMDNLIKIQEQGLNQMCNALSNFRKASKEGLPKPYIEVRLQRLEEMWTGFLARHNQLMELYSNSEEFDSSTYVTEEVYDVTESLYLEYKVLLLTAAETVDIKPEAKCTGVKLPKIVIPSFSGKYTEWITFRDLFESLVHNNNAIDNVQKIHYLKGYLTGEAEQLIRHTPISEANYKICWELIKERYENKRFICKTIFDRLLSFRNGTCESAAFLKELIDTSTDCLHALKNINIDVSTWDSIVIHLLTLKLDPETRKQWELTAASNLGSNELPTFEQFKTFITNRFRALEFIETKEQFDNNSIPMTPRIFHVARCNQCPFCSGAHKICFCKKFARLGVDSRRGIV